MSPSAMISIADVVLGLRSTAHSMVQSETDPLHVVNTDVGFNVARRYAPFAKAQVQFEDEQLLIDYFDLPRSFEQPFRSAAIIRNGSDFSAVRFAPKDLPAMTPDSFAWALFAPLLAVDSKTPNANRRQP